MYWNIVNSTTGKLNVFICVSYIDSSNDVAY